ncbi:zinc transporter ZIP3-like isoform X2 [Zootermopsis nevadensis]|uniref:Zinc transporter ZIP1 n=1 Tax=Zootermopsis nevadensis TaxID=136037 RepID=A0A067RSQ9_ZOONE|nr:zinc transporter ZIP3-like isoform X2 [Zootermopsis nevadensis]KDR22854.1 Zinc transporter ZIP1 [Zootermopsis nevadensis]
MAPDLNTTESLLEELLLRDYSDSGINESTIASKVATAGSELIVAKIVAMLVLGLCSFGLGILPVKLASWLHWNKEPQSTKKSSSQHFVISLLLCFGGGVLLYTTFLHLQPEVREAMEVLQNNGELPEFRHDLHFAELVFCAGFFFVYLVEELVHAVLDRRPHEHEDEAVLHRTMSLRRCSRHPTHSGVDCNGDSSGTLIPRVSLKNSSAAGNKNLINSGDNLDNVITNGSTGSSMSASTQGLLNSSLSTIMILDSAKNSPLDAEAHMTGGPLTGLSSVKQNHHHHHGHGHSHAIPFKNDEDGLSTSSSTVAKSFRGLLAVLALSFHAVFEGLAVGLESSVGNVWYLFAAIATHKLVIAFCVGVELISTRTRLVLIFVYLATFAAVTPLGIGVGIALSSDGEDAGTSSTVATVVLQGMAAGTLLYVVFFEVLQRERASTQSGIWQLIAIMAGFVVMFALQLVKFEEAEQLN